MVTQLFKQLKRAGGQKLCSLNSLSIRHQAISVWFLYEPQSHITVLAGTIVCQVQKCDFWETKRHKTEGICEKSDTKPEDRAENIL